MIKIKKSQTADTRTCDWTKVTKEELLENSHQHIGDVRKGLAYFQVKLEEAKEFHDVTKIVDIDIFYKDFKTGFKTTDWWEAHQKIERHHFNATRFIQEDVNLIDILEQIVDGVMAGLARSGTYRQEEMSPQLLERAYKNTIDLLLSEVKVEEPSK